MDSLNSSHVTQKLATNAFPNVFAVINDFAIDVLVAFLHENVMNVTLLALLKDITFIFIQNLC